MLAVKERALYEADWREDELGKALTPRQLVIVCLIAQGLTDGEIARRMGVSRYTVIHQNAAIRAKTGATGRVAVATLAYKLAICSHCARDSDCIVLIRR